MQQPGLAALLSGLSAHFKQGTADLAMLGETRTSQWSVNVCRDSKMHTAAASSVERERSPGHR